MERVGLMGSLDAGAERIFRRLLGAGFECYLVGGSVRDRLLGRKGADLDFTTNARPHELLRLFRGSHYPNTFGTVLIILDGVQYEVTTYRGEGRYSDYRHPDEVAFVDRLEDDLRRRDFTINAMAMDVLGTIVDPFGGRADLDRQRIRAVGAPVERLTEDPLRMIRAARLATQLCFTIEHATWQAIREHASMLRIISRERVRDELLKILASAHPLSGIDFLDHLALLPWILPALAASRRLNRPPAEALDCYQHALQSLHYCRGDEILRLAAVLHPLAEAAVTEAEGETTDEATGRLEGELESLRLSRVQLDRVRRLVAALPDVTVDLPAEERVARRLLSSHGEYLSDLLRLVEAHRRGLGAEPRSINLGQLRTLARLARKVQREGQPLSLADLALSGDDLQRALGLRPGRQVGRLLRLLLERVLDDPALNAPERLLELAGEAAVDVRGGSDLDSHSARVR